MDDTDKKIKILIVDDEPDFMEPMAFWFESKGYLVKTSSSGQDALRMIKEEPPDIILLDIKMPVMDGVETLRRIRKISKDLPVVMVTAFKDEDKFSEAEKLGISGYFSKRDNLTELAGVIEPILRTHKKLKQRPQD